MDERRFRAVLEEIAKTIHSYGEEEIFAALGVIAERFGWELAKRDPGPCCAYAEYYEAEGIMTPIHECPSEAPDAWVSELEPEMHKVVSAMIDGRVRP